MLPDIQPGNTKILYFFNCLLDGMHTTIPYICDFSRGGLNTRLYTLVSKSCSEATNIGYGLCGGGASPFPAANQSFTKLYKFASRYFLSSSSSL